MNWILLSVAVIGVLILSSIAATLKRVHLAITETNNLIAAIKTKMEMRGF